MKAVILSVIVSMGCARFESAHPTAEPTLRLEALEAKLAEQQKFIAKAKEVLASHRAHIIELENRVKLLGDPRLQPAASVPMPQAK
jgi:uncharacterized coiled-coil protein SlyX